MKGLGTSKAKFTEECPLDISDDAVALDGDTNFISVDPGNVLKTTFQELRRSKTLL